MFEQILSHIPSVGSVDNQLIFIGMLALCWRLVNALDGANKLSAQLLAKFSPGAAPAAPMAPPIAAPPPVIAPHAPPVPVPKPSGPFADAPPWFQGALHEIGFHETGNNQGIERYIGMAHAGALGDAWCAIFANAMLEQAGIPGTRSPSSQSFRTNPNFVQLSGPALGAIVVYWRISKASGQGHVGFYRGEDANSVWTLGGNENNMVQIEALPKDSASFGLIGYWWPKSVPLPTTGAVLMPAGSPTSVKTLEPPSIPAAGNTPAGWQTNTVATVFGGQQSAYGPPIDDNSLGVALPYRFEGARPRVRVTNRSTGQSADCDIADVGPWNGITKQLSDPYWQTGTRPQAETGTDFTG